jgi:hypothetical protein
MIDHNLGSVMLADSIYQRGGRGAENPKTDNSESRGQPQMNTDEHRFLNNKHSTEETKGTKTFTRIARIDANFL